MSKLKNIADNFKHLTDKDSKHSYLDVYNNLFSDYIDSHKILEIGVASGGSIGIWLNYFEKAEVYGVDLCDIPPALISINSPRYHHYNRNAYDKELVKLLPNFNIIIDDGPHTTESYHSFLDLYQDKVEIEGLLIIEDVDYYNIDIQSILDKFDDNFQVSVIDLRHIKNTGDDILIVGKRIS